LHVASESETELVLEHKPVILPAMAALLAALPSRAVFDAAAGEVSWSQAGWRRRDHGSCSLGDVTGVDVASPSPNDDGAQRLVLQTTHGPVPLTRDFWGFGRHEQTAAVIREWLERNGRDVNRP
jgi:hypothetical protein